MLQTLITSSVGPVPIYKNRPAPIQLHWTGCGSESVLRSVLTLLMAAPRTLALLLLSLHKVLTMKSAYVGGTATALIWCTVSCHTSATPMNRLSSTRKPVRHRVTQWLQNILAGNGWNFQIALSHCHYQIMYVLCCKQAHNCYYGKV